MNFAVRKLKAGQELKSVHPRFAIVPAHPVSHKASNVKKTQKFGIHRISGNPAG